MITEDIFYMINSMRILWKETHLLMTKVRRKSSEGTTAPSAFRPHPVPACVPARVQISFFPCLGVLLVKKSGDPTSE